MMEVEAGKGEDDPCRLCDENQDVMHSIFEVNEDGKEIMQLIKENIPIILYKTDPLSKQICQSCLENVSNLSSFKKICKETQERQKMKLRAEDDGDNPEVQVFLGIGMDIPDEVDELKDAETSTEDLPVFCAGCKQVSVEGNAENGEMELCSDLHNVLEVTLEEKSKADAETDKVLRKRKILPLYHEPDDSMCSSLTEFTQNTDNNSHCGFEDGSDMESVDSDSEMPKKAKRRKIMEATVTNGESEEKEAKESEEVTEKMPDVNMEEIFLQEPNYRYQPLPLLQLTLNVINMQNIPDYEPLHYIEESTECQCKCGEKFQNWKLLALHEPSHMAIDVGDKIDNPKAWPKELPNADVRNKWLNFFDENGYEENDIVVDVVTIPPEENANNLLVVKETETKNHDGKVDEIILVGNKAMVNGIALSDYSKEERKSFYQSLRIGGLTKKFCTLCRYCFKDNWAIESHYFSSACFYTCRYCGMRFNKQRHKYEEHIKEHEDKKDVKSNKIYAASKVNNFLPKVIQPQKIKTQAQIKEEEERKQREEEAREQARARAKEMAQYQYNFQQQGIKVRNLERRPLPADDVVRIKQEPTDQKDVLTSQSKTGNQAFFCRKCYKVFFKLDEYTYHSQKCNENSSQPPAYRQMVLVPQNRPNNVVRPSSSVPVRNGETGRPMRNCVRETGPYKDEAFIPETLPKEAVGGGGNPQAFVCHICNTPFPTIYSRNSHMRIHKGEIGGGGGGPQLPPKPRLLLPNYQGVNYAKINESAIKREPLDTSMEPMVEIHEEEQPANVLPSSIGGGGGGAVSLTPISKNPNHRPTINPNIMRLVRNNPNITISKGGGPNGSPGAACATPNDCPPPNILNMINAQAANHHSSMMAAMPGPSYNSFVASPQEDKSYKCSSCWEAFANKSHLYFHKKNQCEGSRFPCPFCKKRFGTEAAYSSHIFYSHPE